MSLSSAYQSFLASASANALSNGASLNYITTLTTINNPAAIAKHLSQQHTILQKKQEKVLSTIEGDYALCLDVETTIEFVSGGGAYLPGLDDNFLADRVVTFPIIHIVHFDNERKIQQIRLYWDQGSLLKLVDVIGSRAKNWPIRDGKDQARLIASTAAAANKSMESTTKQMGDVTISGKPPSPSKNANAMRDPHASLLLFAPRETKDNESSYTDTAVAPRASAKPPQRDYHDLFVGNESDASPSSKIKASPTKENKGVVAPKGGAGKNFQPNRLFDVEENQGRNRRTQESPGKLMKADPNKYNHFDFGDGSEEPKQQALKPRQRTKHQSQWDFADFSTPEKVSQKHRPQDVRHFGFTEDDVTAESPTKNTKPIQPRRDAEAHWELRDDGLPAGDRKLGHPRGQGSNNGMGLYKNTLYDEAEQGPDPEKKQTVLSGLANIKDRRKDFDHHFEMTDASPGLGEKSASENNRPIPETRSKAIKMMEAQWEATDTSPAQPKAKDASTNKENFSIGTVPKQATMNTGIKTAGNGMGGKKGASRAWGFGDESDEDGVGAVNGGKFHASKKQQAPKDNAFWDDL